MRYAWADMADKSNRTHSEGITREKDLVNVCLPSRELKVSIEMRIVSNFRHMYANSLSMEDTLEQFITLIILRHAHHVLSRISLFGKGIDYKISKLNNDCKRFLS